MNPRSPTVYLDQSTLSAAFRALGLSDPQASAPYHRLYRWIEAACTDVNICISLTHVLELASTGTGGTHWNLDRAKDMASWLDGLPLVWTAFAPRVRADDAIYWLQRAAGLDAPEPSVFVGTLLTALRPDDGEHVAALLGAEQPSISMLLNVIETTRARGGRDEMLGWAGRAHDTLGSGPVEAGIHDLALQAHARLIQARHAAYLSRINSTKQAQDLLWDTYRSNPLALRSFRAGRAVLEGFTRGARLKTPGSDSWSKQASSGADWLHAMVGAAFCDVFTCDYTVSSWLGNLRSRWGLSPQLSVRETGNDDAFVEAIINATQAATSIAAARTG